MGELELYRWRKVFSSNRNKSSLGCHDVLAFIFRVFEKWNDYFLGDRYPASVLKQSNIEEKDINSSKGKPRDEIKFIKIESSATAQFKYPAIDTE